MTGQWDVIFGFSNLKSVTITLNFKGEQDNFTDPCNTHIIIPLYYFKLRKTQASLDMRAPHLRIFDVKKKNNLKHISSFAVSSNSNTPPRRNLSLSFVSFRLNTTAIIFLTKALLHTITSTKWRGQWLGSQTAFASNTNQYCSTHSCLNYKNCRVITIKYTILMQSAPPGCCKNIFFVRSYVFRPNEV